MSHRSSLGTQIKCYVVRWFGITFSCLGCKCKFTQTLKRKLYDFQFVSSVWIDYRCKLNCFLRIHLKKGVRVRMYVEIVCSASHGQSFDKFHRETDTSGEQSQRLSNRICAISFWWCGAMRRGALCNCFFCPLFAEGDNSANNEFQLNCMHE